MKIVTTPSKILLLLILLSPLAIYLESCKKADTRMPLDTLPILTTTPNPWNPVGNKLVGSGAIGNAQQGSSVAISADGNTLVFSGDSDNNNTGAIWIYNRTNNAWNQVAKLVGSDAVGKSLQNSVAISADGKTVIVGGEGDNLGTGAAWIFTLNNGIWAQQGSKLVGTGAVGYANQGSSVSISGDGNTVVIGGPNDNGDITGLGFNSVGAAWIFTRNNGNWVQQGSRLVGFGAAEYAYRGTSVSISGDGNTVVVGGEGGTWIYARNNAGWFQQGNILVGTGAVGNANQGNSVSISGDGNTVVIGGSADDNRIGAAWIFTRNNGNWAQQGSKLIGTGAVGKSQQGSSVSISSDGNTIISGGMLDNKAVSGFRFVGATWIFTRNNTTWVQQGSKVVGSDNAGDSMQGNSVSINSDGTTVAVGGPGDNGDKGAVWIFNR